jgi:hypothetical protein
MSRPRFGWGFSGDPSDTVHVREPQQQEELVAAELTRIRFEMTAINELAKTGWPLTGRNAGVGKSTSRYFVRQVLKYCS